MNTLAHLSAFVACIWLAYYCFATLGNRLVGTAAIGLIGLFLVLTFLAVLEDLETLRGKG